MLVLELVIVEGTNYNKTSIVMVHKDQLVNSSSLSICSQKLEAQYMMVHKNVLKLWGFQPFFVTSVLGEALLWKFVSWFLFLWLFTSCGQYYIFNF